MGIRIGVMWLLVSVGGWAASFPVVTAEQSQEFPASVLKEDGTLFVIWHDFRNGNRDLYGQKFTPGGTPQWEKNGKPLVVHKGTQGWPIALDDGADGFFLVWGDSRAVAWEETGGRHLFTQRFNGNGEPVWDPPEGRPVSIHAKGTDDHQMVSDGNGGFYVAWEDWRNGNQDIYGQHISADGEALWTPDGAPICDEPADQYDPFVASDGQGGLLVTWWDVNGLNWRTFAQRMSPNGERMWDVSGVRASLTEVNQSGPFIVGDGDGGGFVFWADFRNDDGSYSNIDLYGQRFLPDGSRGWGDAGRPLCTAPESQQHLTGISDGEGGAYVAWLDARDVFDDIFIQHVAADGSVQWEEDGRAVCDAGGRQREPEIAFDGQDLWIAWYDYRRDTDEGTFQDLYVQRLRRDGSRALEPEGRPIFTEPGERNALTIQARNGRVTVVWMEIRNHEGDIYAWFWPD